MVRVLGLPIDTPQAIVERAFADLAALERVVRALPGQIDRGLALGQELVDIGQRVLAIAERLDRQAETINQLGERLDKRAEQLLELGQSMRELGDQIDATGSDIAERAGEVVASAGELITMLPTLERAIALASPLEGAIDRFGRMVDRFPGSPSRRREDTPPET
jgi:transposase